MLVFGCIQPSIAEQQEAIFAGGCFWCIESDFEKLDGVKVVVSGYIGGDIANPSYEQVSSGKSGHTEAVKITFDNQAISYKQLLAHFWVNIDPLDGDGQFCDRGPQYRSELFYLNAKQQQEARQSLDQINASGTLEGPIKTKISKASKFYLAEGYHQDYYKKNPTRYNYYRWSCGRDKRLMQLWGAKKD
jgi:methionine-S-sulfoxide reductase